MNPMAMGVAAAVASSFLGGTSVAATRFIIGAADPILLGVLRFGIGALCLLPLIRIGRGPLPARRDLPAILGLGVLFFAAFPWFFNASLALTTAARGSLALSTLPLLTLAVAVALGREQASGRKLAGILIAMIGVGASLHPKLSAAPEGAWRGDLLMVGAAACGAVYNVLVRPYLRRASPLAVTTIGMLAGAAVLTFAEIAFGSFAPLAAFGPVAWAVIVYLGVVGAALTFLLWSLGLLHATPTVTALTVTVNPLASAAFGVFLLDEPLSAAFVFGLFAVVAGLALAARS